MSAIFWGMEIFFAHKQGFVHICLGRYRVILKKVLFCVFSIIKVSKGKKNFTIKSKDKVLSLGEFL